MATKQPKPAAPKQERGPHQPTQLRATDFESVAASLHELSSRMQAIAELVDGLPDKKMPVKSWKRFSIDLRAVVDISNKFHTAYNLARMANVPGFRPEDAED